MRFLFVHQNFPGQYLHIVRALARQNKHEIIFISEPTRNVIAGVRVIPYQLTPVDRTMMHAGARDLDAGLRRADAVGLAARQLHGLGFRPDIIIGHHGWGELLHIGDIWPDTPMLGYMEFYFHAEGADVGFDPEFPVNPLERGSIRAKNALNHLALTLNQTGQCPTVWQRSTYPVWAYPQIRLLPEGVDLTICSADAALRGRPLTIAGLTITPRDRLVTYVARNLEPYRGFHSLMRALPAILQRRDTKVVLVGGDGISYGAPPRQGGCWREVMVAELGRQVDWSRVAFPGQVDYATYLALLQRSDAHVYLTYPFVASWSLREALAIGAAVVGSDTPPVREFITPEVNGLLVAMTQPVQIAEAVLTILADRSLAKRLGQQAQRYGETHLSLSLYLDAYHQLISRLTGDAEISQRKQFG